MIRIDRGQKRRWGSCAALALSLLILATLSLMPGRAAASSPGYGGYPVTAQIITSLAAAPQGGFWVQLEDISPNFGQPRLDGTYATDGAPQFDDFASPGNIVAVPRTRGYRIVTAYGEIIPRGRPDVSTLCGGRLSNCTGYPANPSYSQPIVGVAATPSGAGLWALDRHGKVWAAGDAVWHGDAQHQGIPTGIAATPSGKGYYIVDSSGGVYSFGDAVFYGSTGGNGSGITGIALSIDENGKVNGYWLVGNDGGIITFGQAPFWGSTGGNNGGSRVISIVAFPGITPLDQPPRRTEGYAWVHADGGVETAGRPVDAATPH